MIKRVPRPFEGVPYWPLITRYSIPGTITYGLIQTGVGLPTANPNTVYLTRHLVPHSLELKGLWLRTHSGAPTGSDRTIYVRVYAVDPSTGRPTVALSPEVSSALPLTANTNLMINFPQPLRLLRPQPILIACTYNGSGITGGTINCSTFIDIGGTDGYSESFDIELTTSSLTFGAGLPSDMTSLVSPTWNGVSANSPANCNWILRCNALPT